MYSVRSDPLPWERLMTEVRGPAASMKLAAAAVGRAREKEREKEKRKKPARVLSMN
jgi:hypothetical protein